MILEKLSPHASDIFVGDTGEDIVCGKKLGMKTVAVTSGNLSLASLKSYKPEKIIDSVLQLEETIIL